MIWLGMANVLPAEQPDAAIGGKRKAASASSARIISAATNLKIVVATETHDVERRRGEEVQRRDHAGDEVADHRQATLPVLREPSEGRGG